MHTGAFGLTLDVIDEPKWVTTCCAIPSTEDEISQESKKPSYNPFVRPHHLCNKMVELFRINEHDVPNTLGLALQ